MNRTWPPPHVMRVGFEPNQQGQAALHEQASSSWPTILQEVFGDAGFCASTASTIPAAPAMRSARRAKQDFLPVMAGLHRGVSRGSSGTDRVRLERLALPRQARDGVRRDAAGVAPKTGDASVQGGD